MIFWLLFLMFIFIAYGKHFPIFSQFIPSSEFTLQQFFFNFVPILFQFKNSLFNLINIADVLTILLYWTLLIFINVRIWLRCGLWNTLLFMQESFLIIVIGVLTNERFVFMMSWSLRAWIGLILIRHAALVLMEVCLALKWLTILDLTARFLNWMLIALWLNLMYRRVATMIRLWSLTAWPRKVLVTYSVILGTRHF